MNRKQRRAWYREKSGMSYGDAKRAARDQSRLEAAVLKMSPEGARRLLAEWASQQHSQTDIDAMNGRTADADQHQADV